MIAFYVVSNIALFNAVNVKKQYYPEIKADLLIRFVNGTAQDLVEIVRNLKIFENIYMINYPVVDTRKGCLGKLNKLSVFSYERKQRQFIHRYLDILVPNKIYDVLLSLHMDAHCLYFADYFRKKKKDITLEFFEDGTASYLCTKSYLAYRPMRWSLGLKKYVVKCIGQAPTRMRLRGNITDKLYIYAAEQYDSKKGFLPQKLKMSDTCYTILKTLEKSIDPILQMYYEKRYVYYIANAIAKAEPTYDFAYNILDCIVETLGKNKVIIKTHASASTENKLQFASQYEEVAYIDRNVYLLEGLLLNIPHIEQRVIISRASTAMLLPKLWLNKEPYLIITLRLFPYYGQYGDPGGDDYIDMLKRLYSDPGRILVPNTLGELKTMLRQVQKRIYAERFKTKTPVNRGLAE